MYAVQSTNNETLETTVISEHKTLVAAIEAARGAAAEAEAEAVGAAIIVADNAGDVWWDNEGNWRYAVPGEDTLDRMEVEAKHLKFDMR